KYLSKLLAAGFKVAICEQVEDPKKAKGLVDRDIVEIMTPGTATVETDDSPEPSYILCPVADGENVALAVADLLSGEFSVETLSAKRLIEKVELLLPKEILVSEEIDGDILDNLKTAAPAARMSYQEPWKFADDFAREALKKHFQVEALDCFGDMTGAELAAAGGLFAYFRDLKKGDMAHIRALSVQRGEDAMHLDAATVRNLELVRSIAEGTSHGTLLWIIDATCTPMGHRVLRNWILSPLIFAEAIEKRQNAVGKLLYDAVLLAKLREHITNMGDLERLVGKLGNEKANPRDLIALKTGLDEIPNLLDILSDMETPFLNDIAGRLDPMDEARGIIGKNIKPEPALRIVEGGVIADGVSPELDELRKIRFGGKQYLNELQERLREELDISKLKIGYNKVFGYYIEVSKGQTDKVPESFERKQTLVGSERYITPELKEYEQKVLSAEERIFELEKELFLTIREHLATFAGKMLEVAHAAAELDAIAALAEIARRKNWVKPEFTEEDIIEITEGRHPVVEEILGATAFVPNDTRLTSDENQILIVTGPNMSGKSTYLRQVALIVLLAQTGSYVPAQKCRLRPVDRIFTRVGAMDNIARGQSTFLVEMIEAANILNNSTTRSLVLLDEIGRGTSTYDGLAIAWALSEFLHENKHHRAKTIFATHYHELTALPEAYPRVKNFQVAVRERGETVQFLHKIVPGGCDDSYGIYVAKLAGVPETVIGRAKQVLSVLESGETLNRETVTRIGRHKGKTIQTEGVQISLFEPENHPIVQQLRDMDPERMTPLDALDAIVRWRKKWIR
ncbi:DNA mismatch repair protein MutS, partial [bacterium]